eukprot:COSAG02_NODE_709_length_18217_cov_13.019704_6_plen_873_part_00
MLGAEASDVPPPVLVLDIVAGANMLGTAHIILDWDPREGLVDHFFELRPSVSFQQHGDHSRTVDNKDERRTCEHGTVHLQILLLYQVATGDQVVAIHAPIITQVCEGLFKSKTRERALVDRLANVVSEPFANSRLVGFLQVKVCRARQLPSIVSDPRVYCTAEMEGQLYLTSTVASMTPEWDHSVCFGISDVSSALQVCVLQRSSGNHDHDEVYGAVDIVPLDFVGDPNTASAFRRWYFISNFDLDDNSGQIELKFYYVPKHLDSLMVTDDFEDTAAQITLRRCKKVLHDLSQRALQMEAASQTLEYLVDGLRDHRVETDSQMEAERMAEEPIGCLRVAILKGKQLPKMDEHGAADPYCIVRFGSLPQERTLTCHQTLEPDWEQQEGTNAFIFDVHTLDSKIHIQIWDEDEEDADDFMDEVEIPVRELWEGDNRGKIISKWKSCVHTDAQVFVQMGLSEGSQRNDKQQRLADIEREKKELDNAPVHFRYSMKQAEALLNRTKQVELTLKQQKLAAMEETKEVKRQLAKEMKRHNEIQQKLSMKRVLHVKKLRDEQRHQEELEKAVEKWNKQPNDTDEDGFCDTLCECFEIPNELIPTVVRASYGIYCIVGLVTLVLGFLVHQKVGYIESVFTVGVAGTGFCMAAIGAVVVFFTGQLQRTWGWQVVLVLNVVQLVMLGFVACDAGMQHFQVSNQVLPLLKDWWGLGNGHPSHSLGQNLECILAIQDSSASAASVDVSTNAFDVVISQKCGASIQHRMDMFSPPTQKSTFGFQCTEWARAPCLEWEAEFLEAATASCSDTQFLTESDCSASGAVWMDASVEYLDATGNDAVRPLHSEPRDSFLPSWLLFLFPRSILKTPNIRTLTLRDTLAGHA